MRFCADLPEGDGGYFPFFSFRLEAPVLNKLRNQYQHFHKHRAALRKTAGNVGCWIHLTKFSSLSTSHYGAISEQAVHFRCVQAHNQWTALEKAPAESIKGRIAGWGNALMRRAHPGEQFLKRIPRDAGEVEIVYPAGVNPKLVRRRVRLLARR
jgi:hypothetical protein